MTKFFFVARDSKGKTIRDVADASNKNALVQKIQKQGYFIISIQEYNQQKSATSQKSSTRKNPAFTHKKVKLDDLLTFSRQLATMLDSGVTLIRSVSVIQTQIRSEQLAHIVAEIKENVEQGHPFSLALSKHPKVFNQFWVSLMEVGEASGTIPTVLYKLTFYLEQQAAFRSTIISGLIYPAILFAVAQGAIAFFALVVGPKFEEIFKAMDVDLPLLTVVLLAFFRFLKTNFIIIIITTFISLFIFKKWSKTYTGRLYVEKFLFKLPTIGEVYKNIIIERFASQMAILIESGVPILYALNISEKLVDNNNCALVIHDIREGVKEGQLLVGPMEKSGFFPPMAIQMIMVGEETGELSKMLNHVADYYQNAVEVFMKRFATIVEPFMLIFMGGIIGIIVVAMFMPMFNISKLGGGGMMFIPWLF